MLIPRGVTFNSPSIIKVHDELNFNGFPLVIVKSVPSVFTQLIEPSIKTNDLPLTKSFLWIRSESH